MKKHLTYILTVIFFSLIFYSCKTNEVDVEEAVIKKPQSVEEHIKDLQKTGKAVQVLDLSNKQLKELPDLSRLKVSSLDLSNNQLTSIDFSKLPDNLNNLNLSHNKLTGSLKIEKKEEKIFDTIDISNNNLNYVSISSPIYKLDASHNDLTIISFNHKNIEYLDISYNRNHSNLVEFNPLLIKTIKRDGIANDEPLIAKWKSGKPWPN